jgi:peptidoglycan/LPS O-acetylase OafA/YrhL
VAAARKPHVRELDLVRALTVLGVIAVHSTWFTTVGASYWPSFVMDALHYTREVFLFLTGFVLFYTYYDRKVALKSWWLRRFKLVGIPYVIFSAAYLIYGGDLRHGLIPYLATLGPDLVTGTAWFHLYYLIVTMQIYLLFPVFVWLVRKTEGHHGWLLAAAAVVQLAIMWLAEFDSNLHGLPAPLQYVWDLRGQFFFTYEFYIFLGAVASIHMDTLYRIVVDNARWVVVGLVLSLAAMWAFYVAEVGSGAMTPIGASGVFQPLMVPYAMAIILSCVALGVRWARSESRWPRVSQFITLAAELSFGVYLLHPMILQELTGYGMGLVTHWPRLIVTPLMIAAVYVVTTVIIRILAATPLSVYLIGRNQIPVDWAGLRQGIRARLLWGRAKPLAADMDVNEAQ